MRELKDGIRSIVKLDYTGQVHKTFRGTDRQVRYDREVEVLRLLEERGCDYVPRLLEAHDDELRIVTTNCGAPAPQLSEKKAASLFHDLTRDFGIVHDDPFPRNVTYSHKLGRFCIIDFELATILPEPQGDLPHDEDVWRVTWAASSVKGSTHTANDDSFLISSVADSGAEKRESIGEHFLDPAHVVLVVSDGMGGRNAGELASRLITRYVRTHAPELFAKLETAPDDLSPLEQLLKDCHQGLVDLASEDDQIAGMGATATLAWITSQHLYLAHIGDSRLYRSRNGETLQLSKDHSLAWSDWQTRGYSEYEYRQHPRRAALYECLGSKPRTIHPQIERHHLERGDRYLLCSDGVIDGLWQKSIQAELQEGDIEDTASRISQKAVAAAGQDDTTLIAFEIT